MAQVRRFTVTETRTREVSIDTNDPYDAASEAVAEAYKDDATFRARVPGGNTPWQLVKLDVQHHG